MGDLMDIIEKGTIGDFEYIRYRVPVKLDDESRIVGFRVADVKNEKFINGLFSTDKEAFFAAREYVTNNNVETAMAFFVDLGKNEPLIVYSTY